MIKLVQNPKRYYWKRETTYDVIPWTRPNLTANGTIGGNAFACTAINAHSGKEAYKAFDSATNTDWEPINKTAYPQWIEWYNPNALKTTQIVIVHGSRSTMGNSTIYYCFIEDWKLQASEDGNTWVDIASGTVPSSDVTFYRSLTISISNTNFYKYWRFNTLSIQGARTRAYVEIFDIAITATQKVSRTFVIPGTENDYDYYTDGFEYKIIKEKGAEVEKSWVQPIVTEYGTGGGNTYNASAGSYFKNNETYNPIHAFDTDNSTFWASNSTSDYLLFYSPVKIKPTVISITNRSSNSNTWAIGTVLGSLDGLTYYTLAEFTNTNNTASSIWTINIENPQWCKFIKIDGSGMSDVTHTLGVVQCTVTATQMSTENTYKGVNQ